MASTIKSNTVTNATASTLTLGESGTTVTLACGATQSGFGRTGTVDWCTTVKTSPLTAVSGKGYFINTCGGAVTVTLPASPSAGDIVSLKDYKDTWAVACKSVTLGRNSSKIGGQCLDADLSTKGQSITMIYVDGTQGWENIQTDTTIAGSNFITASGGTESTCGDYKIHKFTSCGTFCVSGVSDTTPANNVVAYMVVAGGGGGGGSPNTNAGSGGGAGGFREGTTAPVVPYTASPLVAGTGLPVSVQGYPVIVGGGGAGSSTSIGTQGSTSTFSSISSAGGGRGATGAVPGCATNTAGGDGGSGGGGAGGNTCNAGGSGDTPNVTPDQGFDGGSSRTTPGPDSSSGGGGGATAVGIPGGAGGTPCASGGAGGAGATTSISGASVSYAGGGGGVGYPGSGGAGGTGGGGQGKGNSPSQCSAAGTANTGGGAGAGWCSSTARQGGPGVVIIRYKYQ